MAEEARGIGIAMAYTGSNRRDGAGAPREKGRSAMSFLSGLSGDFLQRLSGGTWTPHSPTTSKTWDN